MTRRKWLTTIVCGGVALMIGCKRESTATAGGKKKITIGMVAKSQSNDVFVAAHAGADAAAKEFGEKYGAAVVIDWRTPTDEDATKQAEAIEALTRAKVQAIIVSCSEAATVTPAINAAVDAGIPVMCFDSDAPKSRRFAYYGTADADCGQRITQRVIQSMGDAGTVAILAGNQSAPNLQKRVEGAKAEIAKHPNVKLLAASGGGVFYHEETPEKAAEAVANATNANPQITGWAFIGGWPLFTKNALKWDAGKIKVASCDALPPQLDYVRSGHVDALFAQDCYGWGHKGVETILEKLAGREPETAVIIDPLTVVTKTNVDEYAKNWEKWLGKK